MKRLALLLSALATIGCTKPVMPTKVPLEDPIGDCRRDMLKTISGAYRAYDKVSKGECEEAYKILSKVSTPESCNGVPVDRSVIDGIYVTNLVGNAAYERIQQCREDKKKLIENDG